MGFRAAQHYNVAINMDMRAVKFRAGSEWRVGGLYSPSLAGRHAAVLFLHGFPGLQKNEDMAAELCRRGLVVFMPFYRGCWGSSGRFSVAGLLPDALAALRLLRRYRHVDASRVGVVGLSLGGWLALRLAAARPVAAAVAIAPAVDGAVSSQLLFYVRKNGKVLNIPAPRSLLSEFVRVVHAVDPADYVPKIAPCPLLFVQGVKDRLVPVQSTRKLWALAREPKELVELDEEHEFQRDRSAVVKKVCGWLEERLSAAPQDLMSHRGEEFVTSPQ